MRVRVIGVGTRRGDDVAGLVVAERLRGAALPPQVEVATCERPALDLLDALAGSDAVVLVDATRSGRAPGAVHRPAASALRPGRAGSSHGLGVAEVLALAEALGRRPQKLAIVGVEAGAAREGPACPAVRSGIDEACAMVHAIVSDWCGGGRPGEADD